MILYIYIFLLLLCFLEIRIERSFKYFLLRYCFSFSDQVRELFSTDVLVERDISIIWMKVESMFEQRVEIERTVVTEWRIVSIAMFDWIQRVFFIIVECNAWTFYSATLECVELIVISCAVERSGQRNAVLIRSRNRRTKFAIELHSIHLYLFTFVQASWTELFFIRNCCQNCFFIL